MKPRERRTVLGRPCQVYRTGSPIESLSVTAPSSSSYSDSCVDASGLLLEEVSVSGGTVTSRVLATAVDDQPTISADNFTITGTPQGVDAGGVGLDPVDPATPPVAGYWQFTTPPPGWMSQGRYMMTTQSPDTGDTQQTFVDVFVRGVDFLVLEQGPTSAQPPADIIPGSPVNAGGLGSSQVVPGLAGNTLTANPNPNWFVRLVGSVPADALAQIASALHT
jgi:hypothetical protein